MKKYSLLLTVLATTCLSCFGGETDLACRPVPEEIQVVQLVQLTDDDLKEIMQGQRPELAIEFSAHTHLPISFYLKGDLAALSENDEKWGVLEIKQTFYARAVSEGLILSTDLIDWKPLMEFITGTASISFINQDGQLSIVIGSESNRRS